MRRRRRESFPRPHRNQDLVSDSSTRETLWRLLTLLAWGAFFATGFMPHLTYATLRTLGRVTTQDALVNSPLAVVIAWAAFLGFFAYFRCRDAGCSREEALTHGGMAGVIATVAFVPLPWMLVARFREIPQMELRIAVMVVAASKLITVLFLIRLMLRYYLREGVVAFLHPLSGSTCHPQATQMPGDEHTPHE